MGRLNAELSDEAHDLWREYAASKGVSVTALLEAFAFALGRGPAAVWSETITRARAVDAERRARSGPT